MTRVKCRLTCDVNINTACAAIFHTGVTAHIGQNLSMWLA